MNLGKRQILAGDSISKNSKQKEDKPMDKTRKKKREKKETRKEKEKNGSWTEELPKNPLEPVDKSVTE